MISTKVLLISFLSIAATFTTLAVKIAKAANLATKAKDEIQVLCGAADLSGITFSVLEFKISSSEGIGVPPYPYAQTLEVEKYPVANYRLISFQKSRYRIGAQIKEHEYNRGELHAIFSIYEEDKSKLVQRHYSDVSLSTLTSLYHFSYKALSHEVSCHITVPVAQIKTKNKNRIPAKLK